MADQLTPEEIQRAFDAYNEELLRTGKVTRETADAFNDAKAGIKNYTFQLNQSLKQLGTSMLSLGESLKDGKQGASVYNDSIKAGADAVDAVASKFGILGKVIGGIVTVGARYVIEVNKQSDKLFESYQTLSKIGAVGASGMTDIFRNMQNFGYNIEQLGDFGNLIKSNSESLAQLGGTVTQGTQAFAGVAKGIQRSGLQTEFMSMGMTVDDVNQGIAGFLALQSKLGATQTKTQQQLTEGAAEYIRNLDVLIKLTGKNAKTLEDEQKARQADQQYRAVMRSLQKRGEAGDQQALERAAELENAMKRMGPENAKALQQAMTGFVGAGKEGEKLFRTSARAFAYASDKNFKASVFMDMLTEDFSKQADAFGDGLANLNLFNDTFTNFAEGADMESKARTKSFQQQEAEAKAIRNSQAKNAEGAIKAQVGLRQEQMETTRGLQTFINQGINPITKGMSKLGGAMESVSSSIPGTGAETGTAGTGRGNVMSLLDIIGRGESGGNYNVLVGGKQANLTGMTIAEVQKLQSTMLKSGHASTAVGKYQITKDTLAETVKKAGLDPSTTKFDQQTQDLLATQLIYQAGFGTKDPKTVMNNLAGRWAALPKDMSGAGRHDRFNGNQANINPNELMAAIQSGPTDSYTPALKNINTNIPSVRTEPETTSALNSARNSNDLLVIQIARMDELIGLMKANNAINSKILQRARN